MGGGGVQLARGALSRSGGVLSAAVAWRRVEEEENCGRGPRMFSWRSAARASLKMEKV